MASFLLSSGPRKLTIQEEPGWERQATEVSKDNVRTAHEKGISKSSAKSVFKQILYF